MANTKENEKSKRFKKFMLHNEINLNEMLHTNISHVIARNKGFNAGYVRQVLKGRNFNEEILTEAFKLAKENSKILVAIQSYLKNEAMMTELEETLNQFSEIYFDNNAA